MADYENRTNENGAENNTPYAGAANSAQNAGSSNDPYAYQNGYYRNTAPHQDEPVGSGAAGNSQTTPPPVSGGNGYSYVNYYSVPNGNISGGSPKNNNPKKKHTGLKIAACVLAMAVVSGASIGIYEGISSSLETRGEVSSIAERQESSSVADSSADLTKKDSSNAESWIQLASTKGAMSVSDIVKKVTPSVVGVQAQFKTETSGNDFYGYGNFFGFGNQGGQNSTQEATGVGTGIIMSKDGYIVTNAHVIYDDEYGYGKATAVQVQMYDEETTYDARIVAFDQEADIAVLQIDADDLTPAEFGDSSTCEVGEMVVAIGNPLGLEFQNTVTCGIISALNRQVTINDNTMTLIQTDTAINSGNSGGPLINSAGQVIGINSAKMSSSYSSSSATIEGIGFAIPMTEAQKIIDDLINYGYVTGRPQLGISCQDVSETVSQAYQIPVGVYIISVTEGGAAEQAGLKPGDVITAIQGETIQTTDELNNIKNQYNAGDVIKLTVSRTGESQSIDIEVTLEEVTKSAE